MMHLYFFPPSVKPCRVLLLSLLLYCTTAICQRLQYLFFKDWCFFVDDFFFYPFRVTNNAVESLRNKLILYVVAISSRSLLPVPLFFSLLKLIRWQIQLVMSWSFSHAWENKVTALHQTVTKHWRWTFLPWMLNKHCNDYTPFKICLYDCPAYRSLCNSLW